MLFPFSGEAGHCRGKLLRLFWHSGLQRRQKYLEKQGDSSSGHLDVSSELHCVLITVS